MSELYSPPDVDEQNRLWGANCGPCALAALTNRPVADIRAEVEIAQGGRFLGYMNAGHLTDVLRRMGFSPWRRDVRTRGEVVWPRTRGLVVLQIDGPWCEPGVNPRARFRYTHTVASAEGGVMIYDCNADKWRRRENWEREIMAFLVKDQKRATGWYTSSVIDVAR